jgi:hypothetical protein
MAVVGAPSHFAKRSPLHKPQDLIGHDCINLRLPTRDELYSWEFDRHQKVVPPKSRIRAA